MWTGEQVCILITNASRGADAVAEELARAGYARSVSAVQRTAARMGVSLARWDVCLECGDALPADMVPEGICPACKARKRYEEAERRWRKTWDEVRAAGLESEMEARGFRQEVRLLDKRTRALRRAAGLKVSRECLSAGQAGKGEGR